MLRPGELKALSGPCFLGCLPPRVSRDSPLSYSTAAARAAEANVALLRHVRIGLDDVEALVRKIVALSGSDSTPVANEDCGIASLLSSIVRGKSTGTQLPDDSWCGVIPQRLLDTAPSIDRDRAIVNYVGALVAIDFRHWVGSVSTPIATADYTSHEAQYRQYYYVQSRSEQVIHRGSYGMMMALKDAVDLEADGSVRQRWWCPDALCALLDAPGAADPLDALRDLFSGADPAAVEVYRATPERNINLPNSRKHCLGGVDERLCILKEIADLRRAHGLDFFDLLVACQGRMFGDGGFVNALLRYFPRFRDGAVIHGVVSSGSGADSAPEFHWLTDGEFSACSLPAVRVNLLFIKLPLLLTVALRSVSKLLTCSALEWLRTTGFIHCAATEGTQNPLGPTFANVSIEEPATPTLTVSSIPDSGLSDCSPRPVVCMDYQVPNALRHAGLLHYDDVASSAVKQHTLLPAGSRIEVEIRLAGVLAADLLRESLESALHSAGCNLSPSVADVDYALWLFGRTLTSTGRAQFPHHLCPGIMY